MNDATPNEALRRGVLPEVMFTGDMAVAAEVTEATARKMVRRGEFGPYLLIGRRYAVLRESFLGALRAREVVPEVASPPHAPRPKPEYLKLLRRHRAGRGRP